MYNNLCFIKGNKNPLGQQVYIVTANDLMSTDFLLQTRLSGNDPDTRMLHFNIRMRHIERLVEDINTEFPCKLLPDFARYEITIEDRQVEGFLNKYLPHLLK